MARLDNKVLFFTTSPRTPSKMIPEIELLCQKFEGTVWNKVTVNKVMNAITNYFWSFTSLGGIIAFVADRSDGKVDGYIG